MSGMAGVGKTALAVHWAHQVAGRFPDGQLYVNLRGFDPAGTVATPGEVVRSFLDALDVPAQRIPAGLDAQTALYRSVLADRRMLVLLDNARDAEQVRPLLPGTPGCLVLVTSRNQLTGLIAGAGAVPLPLDLLNPDEARDLLARRVGVDRIAAEPAAVDEIIERCARLPLALAIVAARAATPARVAAGRARRRVASPAGPARRAGHRRSGYRCAVGVLLVLPAAVPTGCPTVPAAGRTSRPGPERVGRGQPRRDPTGAGAAAARRTRPRPPGHRTGARPVRPARPAARLRRRTGRVRRTGG